MRKIIAGAALAAASLTAVVGLTACSRTNPTANATAAWCLGTGYANFQAVNSDLSQIDTDSGDGYNPTALEADGSQLESDAAKASGTLYPGDPADYGLWVTDLRAAGMFASIGDFTSADNEMNDATAFARTVCAGYFRS